MSLNLIRALLILNAKKGWSEAARKKAAMTRKAKKKPAKVAASKSTSAIVFPGLKGDIKIDSKEAKRNGFKDLNDLKTEMQKSGLSHGTKVKLRGNDSFGGTSATVIAVPRKTKNGIRYSVKLSGGRVLAYLAKDLIKKSSK